MRAHARCPHALLQPALRLLVVFLLRRSLDAPSSHAVLGHRLDHLDDVMDLSFDRKDGRRVARRDLSASSRRVSKLATVGLRGEAGTDVGPEEDVGVREVRNGGTVKSLRSTLLFPDLSHRTTIGARQVDSETLLADIEAGAEDDDFARYRESGSQSKRIRRARDRSAHRRGRSACRSWSRCRSCPLVRWRRSQGRRWACSAKRYSQDP